MTDLHWKRGTGFEVAYVMFQTKNNPNTKQTQGGTAKDDTFSRISTGAGAICQLSSTSRNTATAGWLSVGK